MANEDKKDFNAMLMDSKDMPKIQIITDEKSIEKYGGDKMYFAPPIDYEKVMRLVPCGKLLTVGTIREYFAKQSGADFTEPITAGIFVSIVAWASYQRAEDKTPYWRTLKANGELNAKYPGGVEAQKELLEKEGHIVIQKGRTNIKYYVKDGEPDEVKPIVEPNINVDQFFAMDLRVCKIVKCQEIRKAHSNYKLTLFDGIKERVDIVEATARRTLALTAPVLKKNSARCYPTTR